MLETVINLTVWSGKIVCNTRMPAGDIFRRSANDLQNALASHAEQIKQLRVQAQNYKQHAEDTRKQAEILEGQARDVENQVGRIKQQIRDLSDDAARADAAETLLNK